MKNYGAIILSCAVLLILPIIAGAQDYTRIKGEIREKADKTPSALMDDPGKLAKYLTKDLSQDWLKAYSIYYWVATNLGYDLSMARKGGTFTEAKEPIDYALENKKGDCQHYAELFNYLAKQSGLESLGRTG
ncbi:MAG: transglutaminase-like domain-containing protein [Bacteroidales bacterium]|nr:transglutaminase-like domain-containing protein [Bacteroidales bacterium]